jgi:carbonic anhydrase/acetyltransferase-like protein (isoleucine patch superfamily)
MLRGRQVGRMPQFPAIPSPRVTCRARSVPMLTEATLNLLAYHGTRPQLASMPRHAGANCAVVGRVTLGRDAWLGAASVIRADGHYVRVGDRVTLGHGATIHIAHELYPAVVGNDVTIGNNAVVHACEVHDGCVIEDGAVILDGCVVEAGAVIEAGSVVYPRTRLAGGQAYAGKPARARVSLSAAEVRARREELIDRLADDPVERVPPTEPGPHVDRTAFIANTASLIGHVVAKPHSSVWYSCELDAAGGEIVIGDRTNLQDNSVLRCTPGGRLVIGKDCTIGHNVTMADCVIGDRCLIGIGSVVAPGTVVEDDVLLAAGASTLPGQVLANGQLWGGQPARVIAPLDQAKRAMIAKIVVEYCEYGVELARVQRELAAR